MTAHDRTPCVSWIVGLVVLVEVSQELIVVNLAISCCVDLLDQLADVDTLKVVTKDLAKVVCRDEATLLVIKPVEGLPQDVLVDLDASLQRSCEELTIVNLVVVVDVKALEECLSLITVDMKDVLQHLLHLIVRDGPFLVCVQRQELLAQLCAILGRERPSHHGEHCALEARGVREVPEAQDDVGVDDRLLVLAAAFDPGMLKRGLRAEPRRRVEDEECLHEVDCRLRQPMEALRELRLASLDLLQDLVVGAVERRAPCQQHVHDDADRPQVSLLVVRFPQHLWRDVVHGAARL
mmetsp:Transcript_37162/g.118260  ORF Transcript_37162/g.118260 Transcript_37162/m.118260 type:complete len:294 (-) Transcript_37162:645-1526(-)